MKSLGSVDRLGGVLNMIMVLLVKHREADWRHHIKEKLAIAGNPQYPSPVSFVLQWYGIRGSYLYQRGMKMWMLFVASGRRR